MSTLHIIWTLFILVSFLAIVAWAYSGKRKKKFEADGAAILENGDDGHE
ncbi:MAG: cbb3-type cytochrome c oxidase subunit 3 [Gammaproteobacteria bacterium]|jgi:cbb3-type cytochrome oxidase subunit 3|nr:cbb3-type cytochrome c oxidase subunit 3 [Gammaproteobacteria bacterium]